MARKRVRRDSAEYNSQEAQNLVQEVGPVPGDDRDKLERICGSLVKIVCYKPQLSRRKIKWVLTAVVVASGDKFCQIIALWNAVLIRDKSSSWTFEVILPDGTRMNLPRPIEGVHVKEMMAVFTLETSAKVNPVQISAQEVSQNDLVFAVGFSLDLGRPHGLQAIISYRSAGFVTHARNAHFSHDCPPCNETYEGGPVFNKQDQFVGITYKDRGIAVALSISTITKLLAAFHDGMMGQPMFMILKCIKDNAEPPKQKKRLRKKSKKTK